MLAEKLDPALIQSMIDSSRAELKRTQNVTGGQPNRRMLAYALAMQDPQKNRNEINGLIKNLPEKLGAIRGTARSFAFNQDMYDAKAEIPALISDDDMAGSLWPILFEYARAGTRSVSPEWKTYQQNYLQLIIRNINYQDESN